MICFFAGIFLSVALVLLCISAALCLVFPLVVLPHRTQTTSHFIWWLCPWSLRASFPSRALKLLPSIYNILFWRLLIPSRTTTTIFRTTFLTSSYAANHTAPFLHCTAQLNVRRHAKHRCASMRRLSDQRNLTLPISIFDSSALHH